MASTDIVYKLIFDRPVSVAKKNIVNLTLISEDSKGKINKVVTEIETFNSLQVVNRGNNKEPATVMFYRLDDRPMTEDVSGAMIFILDTSGSMIDNTVYNVNAKKKIDALKEVFEGKSLKLNKTSLKLDFNPTTNNSFTAFVVYRNIPSESVDSYNIICRRKADNENGWKIGLYDGKLGFTIKQRNNMIKNITQSTNTTLLINT